jgi:hypothetical protein
MTHSRKVARTHRPWPPNRRRLVTALCAVSVLTACEQPKVVSPGIAAPQPNASYSVLVDPVADRAMGELSPLARHLSAALRDSTMRLALAKAMKDSSASGSVDLQDCANASIAEDLLANGQRHLGGSANQFCAMLRALPGAILYMDPQRLQAWDGQATPIVTALSDPRAALPDSIVGYRSPSRSITMARTRIVDGPLLVILPYAHPRTSAKRRNTLTTEAIGFRLPDSLTPKRAP